MVRCPHFQCSLEYRCLDWQKIAVINLIMMLGIIPNVTLGQSTSNSPQALPEEISLEDPTPSPGSSPPPRPKSPPPPTPSRSKKVKPLGTAASSTSKVPSSQSFTPSPSESPPPEDETSAVVADNAEEEGDEDDSTWESYKEDGFTGSMQDISERVKIQDIVEPPTVYHYAAFGKPDPFRPLTRNQAVSLAPEALDVEVPIVSALQTVSIQNMHILGIWQGGDGRQKAMVKMSGGSPPYDGDTKGYIIKVGDPIGNKGGIVHSIKPDGVVVREFELLADGTRQYADSTLPFTLQITAPEAPLGSWIFKPGLPEPERKYPEGQVPPAVVPQNNGNFNPAPNTLGLPPALPDGTPTTEAQAPEKGSARFAPRSSREQNGSLKDPGSIQGSPTSQVPINSGQPPDPTPASPPQGQPAPEGPMTQATMGLNAPGAVDNAGIGGPSPQPSNQAVRDAADLSQDPAAPGANGSPRIRRGSRRRPNPDNPVTEPL